MKLICIFIFGMVISAQAQQTNWMKPNRFRFNKGDTCRITLVEGERLIGKYFSIGKDSLGTVKCLINGKLTDITPSFTQNQPHHFAVPLTEEGTYQFYWDRQKSFSLVNLEDIGNYLKENGVGGSPATIDRSLEIHEHTYDILLVQVGKSRSAIVATPEFPLEIIPTNHPYEVRKGDPLGLLIKNHGAPEYGIAVVIRNRYDNRTTVQSIFTEKDGTMRLIISSPGPWLINYATIDTYRDISTIGIKRVNLLFGY
jgi:hypothetical protein